MAQTVSVNEPVLVWWKEIIFPVVFSLFSCFFKLQPLFCFQHFAVKINENIGQGGEGEEDEIQFDDFEDDGEDDADIDAVAAVDVIVCGVAVGANLNDFNNNQVIL